jgi:hypothetical protein
LRESQVIFQVQAPHLLERFPPLRTLTASEGEAEDRASEVTR